MFTQMTHPRGRAPHTHHPVEANERRPDEITHVIKIRIGEDYMAKLRERLQFYEISQGQLARQMDITPSQLSRLFNRTNPSGKPMQPSLETIYRIEQSLIDILAERRGRRRKRPE